MVPLELNTIFAIIYFIIWITSIGGITFIRSGNPSAKKMQNWLQNKRIEQFQYPPFKNLVQLWIANKYFAASLTFALLIIVPAALLYFLLGMLLITPLLSLYQGFVFGLLMGCSDAKNIIWSLIVGIFEFGYWALSGALGMFMTITFLFTDMSFTAAFLNGIEKFSLGYWTLLVICILGNAFLEIAGPIYWNMQGAIGLEALSKGQLINE